MTDILAAKKTLKERLKDVEGLRGIGIGWDSSGDLSVIVNVDHRALDEVRSCILNLPERDLVVIKTVGPIRAE